MQAPDARARKAALLLHGLGPQQREAVLARLEAGHLATLRPLLAELAALGIPPSLAQARSRTPAGAGAATPARRDVAPEPLRAERLEPSALGPQRAGRALRGCAVPTVAAVLRDAPTAWREAVLDELPRDRLREVVERLDRAPPLPPRVAQALQRRLAEEVADAPIGRCSTRSPRGWKRWLPWTR
jgi:hypothetical protein